MGVRHLIAFLRSYADVNSLAGKRVVIDGPAMAYYIYCNCLGARKGARNFFEAAPSYEEVAIATLAWLDRLREGNAAVMMIYFDGYLPPSKLDTRLERLIARSNQLSQYHQINPTPCRASFTRQKKIPPSLFGPSAPRQQLGSLPPLPFLVPAVIEALSASIQYRDKIRVVPGEADIYCAKYLKNRGGLVITGDSDLLVHDLGLEGSVSFFGDIEQSPEDGPEVLRALMFTPAIIASRLRLPEKYGISALAFEISCDTIPGLPDVLRRAQSSKSITERNTEFQQFLQEYTSFSENVTQNSERNREVLSLLRGLDPRISEFVLQFPSLAQIAGQSELISATDSHTPHVFLPFLTDNPTRMNAWEISSFVRQLAYGLINLIVPSTQQKMTVFEHRKQQNKSSGRELQLPQIDSIPEACMAIVKMLTGLREKLAEVSNNEFWIGVAVYQDIEWAHAQSKSPLSQQVALQTPSQDLSWDVVQFFAQAEGSYYSFRILKQIISIVIAHGSTLEPITLLQTQLESLPALNSLQDFSHASDIIQLVARTKMVEVAQEILGIESVPIEPLKHTKAGKRKRKGEKDRNRESTGSSKKSSNPFELLALE